MSIDDKDSDEAPESPSQASAKRPISGVFELNERLRLLGETQLAQGREQRALRESHGRLSNEVLAVGATSKRVEGKVDQALGLLASLARRLDDNDREHGAIARDLGARASQDSAHDLAIAEEKAHRSALTKVVTELAGQVTPRRTVIVGAIAVGTALGRVLIDWLGRHGF